MRVATCRIDDDPAAQMSRAKEIDAWWVKFGDELLIYSANSKWEHISEQAERRGLQLADYAADVRKGNMYLVVQKGRLFQQEYPDARVLLDKGRFLAVELHEREVERIGLRKEPCFLLRSLPENTVIFEHLPAPRARGVRTPWIENLANAVDSAGIESSIAYLASHHTRYSTSAHYEDAASWCRDRFTSLGYGTRLEAISVDGANSLNVVAEKPGEGSGTRELVIVVAHLDSVNASGGPNASAPGADDNASGSAGLLEIAEALKDFTSFHDLRFVLFGGEEQGLFGSLQYVSSLSQTDRDRIVAVVNMDTVGSLNTSDPTVLIEGSPISQALTDDLVSAATTYTSLAIQISLSPYGSDHVPFINSGIPAALTIEGADGSNSNIHTADDIPVHINYDLVTEITRMNVAFVAAKLRRKGETKMFEIAETPEWFGEWIKLFRTEYSGRYSYNGGAEGRAAMSLADAVGEPKEAELANPIHDLPKPVYISFQDWWDWRFRLRFTLHIDIDGTDPLAIVSGTVAKGLNLTSVYPQHFIGRVTSNIVSGNTRNLIVEDFSFNWPRTSQTIDRLEIALSSPLYISPFTPRTAEVTFVASGTGSRHGPYRVTRESRYFREVEVEVDREDDAVDPEPYNTLTHPDRPANLPEQDLTLESVFAKSGIRITRSSQSSVINSTVAGADREWSDQELHDAMENHWSAFANIPQWKMWILIAELADDSRPPYFDGDTLGGIMFDGNIDEPGGVDRQGTALFSLCPFFHTTGGGYILANPPGPEAVERELFFNLIHETGHTFNLAHSFQKTLGSPWTAPAWMPVVSDDKALSWMNYPDRPSAGSNASWFYDRFRFRFDDNENLLLRHAPARYVRMGDEDWFQNHGRVSRGSLDRRLELLIRRRSKTVELGEPIELEMRLHNVGGEMVTVHPNLDPSDGLVEFAITDPGGRRRPFIPISHRRVQIEQRVLDPDESLYHTVNLTAGRFGFPFKEPGPYRIEASYHNLDGGTAAAIMQLWVRPPANYDNLQVISELFDARVGRVFYVGGSRVMEDVNSKLAWVGEGLEEKHPAQYHIASVLGAPLAKPFKILEADSNELLLLDPDPDVVEQRLAPLIEDVSLAADTIGHIGFHRMVDLYTQAALDTKQQTRAVEAQERMRGLFEERKVVQPVIESIDQRIREIK